MRGMAAVVVVVALTLSGCTSQAGTTSATSASHGSPRGAAPVTTPEAWPAVVLARPEPGNIAQKHVGSAVQAADISGHVPLAGSLFGLASCGAFLGSTYPAVSRDDGKSWRIAGPELSFAAAQGADAVEYVTGTRRTIAFWGASIVTSPDWGRTWWRTQLGEGVHSLAANNGILTAVAQGDPVAGTTLMQSATYTSADGGRRWLLRARIAPTPAGPAAPAESQSRACG